MEEIRIIDKETRIWLRDGFHFNPETEMGIIPKIPQPPIRAKSGICPMWDGEKWVQNVDPPVIEPHPQEPTLEEKNRADIDYIAIMTGVEL